MSSNNREWVNKFRGQWVVIEGPDRIGKTTLINNFVSYLVSNGISEDQIVTFAFPQRHSAVGTLLSKHLTSEISLDNKTQVLLFLADMQQTYAEILKAQKQNKIVICDRYTASTYSYALAQRNKDNKDDVSYQWLLGAIGLVTQPDLYIFLRCEDDYYKEEIIKRHGFGSERTETEEVQKKVMINMDEYASHHVNHACRVVVTLRQGDSPNDIFVKLISRLELRYTFAG